VLASWSATPRSPRTEAEFEDENLLLVATHLVRAALQRRDSVGAHFRADDPAPTVTDAAASVTAQLAVGAA
jgi:L-aspartate oxidase